MRAEIGDLHSQPAEEVIHGARRMFPGIAFHWTIKNFGMTYGGLHETEGGAQASKSGILKKAKRDAWKNFFFHGPISVEFQQALIESNRIQREWQNASIIFLNKEEEYVPWGIGKGGLSFIHGKNDGTHHSTLVEPDSAPIFKPHLGIHP